MVIKKCVVCGKEFTAKTNRAKYCSSYCKNRSRYFLSAEDLRKKREELKNEIIKLYDSHLSTKEIAASLGKHPSQINEVWRNAGLPKRMTPLQKSVKKLKDDGYRYFEIARILKKRVTTIKAVAEALGLPPENKKEKRCCKHCGKEFTCHQNSNQVFCSIKCQKAHIHSVHDIKRRSRVNKSVIDRDITIEALAERDHGICQICGKPIDWNYYKIVNGKKVSLGNYPSRDHIIPLCKGGKHTWDNVQLAHIKCNSHKGAS